MGILPKLFLDQVKAEIKRKLVSGEARKLLFSVVEREFNIRHHKICIVCLEAVARRLDDISSNR